MEYINEIHGELCIKSLNKEIIRPDIEKTENFEFGNALCSVYPLLDLIFDYLPLEDLLSCSKTCASWRRTATNAIEIRRNISHFLLRYESREVFGHTSTLLKQSCNFHFINPTLGIIFMNIKFNLKKYICLHKLSGLCKKNVLEFLLEEIIPRNVDYCFISVPSVASNFDTARLAHASTLMEGIFLPKIPNIKTAIFHCDPSKSSRLRETVNNYKKFDERAKCLLVFAKVNLGKNLEDLLMVLAEDYIINCKVPTQIALGGGVISGTKVYQDQVAQKKVYVKKDTVVVAFLEKHNVPSNFSAYSQVIQEGNVESFECQLLKLKEKCCLKKHSFAFLIRCAESEICKNDQVISFGNIFLGVSLVAIDAYGEIGWNSDENVVAPNKDDKFTKKTKRKRQSVFPSTTHCFSSVFLLLTWE